MIDTNILYRPGLAAIAAVLALSTTPVIAQVTLPAEPAPVAAPSAMPAPAAPAAPVQTVQSVPATPSLPDLPVAETRSAAPAARTEAPIRSAARSAPAVAPTARSAPVAPREVTPPLSQSAATPVAADRAPATPAESISAESTRPAAASPTVTETAASDDSGLAGWALLGGGVLLVAGGAAFALSRRPKRRDEAEAHVAMRDDIALSPAAPVVTAEPVVARTAPRQPVHDPIPVRTASAMERRVPLTATEGAGDRRTALEAMVAEQPSEANPFRSRRNRLRRADFLLRTGQAEPRQGEYRVNEEREAVPAGAGDRWSEMRFQGRQRSSVSWKPARS